MDSFACAISLSLQYGVPLQVLCDKFSHMRFEPSGFTGNPELPIAKSISDYIFRWLALKFMPKQEALDLGVEPKLEETKTDDLKLKHAPMPTPPPVQNSAQRQAFLNQADAPPCHVCGTITVRNGACYKCHNCGATSGCS
jgi:ribonucleoside-diphosphate reductase alpha chain